MDNTLLLALGEMVRQEINAPQLLNRLIDAMAQRLGADRGTIFLLDATRKQLISVAAHLPELKELRVPVEQGIAGYVARHKRIVRSPGDQSAPHLWSKVDEQTGYTTQNVIAGPLQDDLGEVIGVVQFLNKAGGFKVDDEPILIDLAKQAAALLQETTLVTKTPHRHTTTPPVLLGEHFNGIIGHSEPMRRVLQKILKVAPTEATVLIRGESGTGKSMIARALHYNSSRHEHPFVRVDCTTLPETLIENELFGHERGAFTGANTKKVGRVDTAAHGTLFLDEVGDLPLAVQGKLLTLLQEKTYTRVGGTSRQHADIRILAATNRDLEALVEQKLFREDLYYRLRVAQVTLPPLRERGQEDVQALIEHFAKQLSKKHRMPEPQISEDAMEMLRAYLWPGNVRELEHCMESAIIFAEGHITPSMLSLPRPKTTKTFQAIRMDNSPFADNPSLRTLEKRYLTYLLKENEGNRSECARILGIGRNTLLRKMKEYNLD